MIPHTSIGPAGAWALAEAEFDDGDSEGFAELDPRLPAQAAIDSTIAARHPITSA